MAVAEAVALIAAFSKRRSTPLEDNSGVFDALHRAVQSTDCNNGLTYFERIAKFALFLLFLLLGADHEEVHDGTERYKHQDGRHDAGAFGSGGRRCIEEGNEKVHKNKVEGMIKSEEGVAE